MTQWENREFPPCKLACPILTDARDYIQLIAERRFEAAYAAIRRQNPLPGVCGRICTHPCEAACKRGQVDEPIAIAALKRFPSDGSWAEKYETPGQKEASGFKVAVIGSGPAGLSAAHDLALMGHEVTIFEALSVLGGMLRVGVPEYRLPKAVVDREIQKILDLGIQVKTGVRIGKDVTLKQLFEEGHRAVFLGIGAHQDRKLGIPGEDDLEGVVAAVSFLREVNGGNSPDVGKRVVVIGGGNTAIDSARSARRLGAEHVHMLYRRSSEEMPAAKAEVEEAIDEGVEISYLTTPLEIMGQRGRVSGLKCVKNELGEPDASGRRSPKPLEGTDFSLDADTVIAAIGQAPEASWVGEDVALNAAGNRIVAEEPETMATSHPGVFAGGDAVTGPATVVAAIAAGKKAAQGIDLYLKGSSESTLEKVGVVEPLKMSGPVIEKTTGFSRCQNPSLPAGDRLKDFDEVVSVLTEDQATREALRCLHCYLGARIDKDKCVSCLTCVRVCPLEIPRATKMGEIFINPVDCQACSMCAVECPVRAIDISLHPRVDILQEIEAAIGRSKNGESLILGFLDLHGNFTTEDLANLRKDYPHVVPVTVFGLARIDTPHVLRAFELGVDGVFLAACPHEKDPFPEARERIKGRMTYATALTELLGLGEGRVQMCDMPEEGLVDKGFMDDLMSSIKEAGPNPVRLGEKAK